MEQDAFPVHPLAGALLISGVRAPPTACDDRNRPQRPEAGEARYFPARMRFRHAKLPAGTEGARTKRLA